MIRLLKKLPPEIREYLKIFSEKADSLGLDIYLVGGIVRDLVLGKRNLDLDIVVEGDAIELVRSLSHDLKAGFRKHHAFGTATLYLDGVKVDFATARREIYAHRGALPLVEPASVKDDLFRRDFTINSMAISLNEKDYGRRLDLYGSYKDIKKGVIRIMHDESFRDDPCRIFRAIRFEQRFGFNMERHTMALLKKAAAEGAFSWISGHRIRNEIVLILKEDLPRRYLKRIKELTGFSFIHGNLKFDSALLRLLKRVEEAVNFYRKTFRPQRELEPWLVYMAALVHYFPGRDIERFLSRFGLKKNEREVIIETRGNVKSIERLKCPVSDVYVFKHLKPLKTESIIFFYAYFNQKEIRSKITRFFNDLSHIRIRLRGADLKNIGVKQESDYGRILQALLYRKIKRKFTSREEELDELGKILGRLIDKKY